MKCEQGLINGRIIKFIPSYDKNDKKVDFNVPNFNGLKIDEISA